MNTVNNVTTAALVKAAQETFDIYSFNLSAFTLLLFVTISRFPEEIDYIWSKRLNLPSLLYIFTRYGALITQGLNLVLDSPVLSLKTKQCYILEGFQIFWFTLLFTGVQGLLIARAYALSGGNKLLATLSAISFMSGLGISIAASILYNSCVATNTTSAEENILNFIEISLTIFTDLIVFGVCIWKTWGTWKLKREIGIASHNGVVSVLVKQSILRCCFVVVITVSFAVFELLNVSGNLVSNILNISQNTLSAILVADFTLELHRHNSKEMETRNIALPNIQSQMYSNVSMVPFG